VAVELEKKSVTTIGVIIIFTALLIVIWTLLLEKLREHIKSILASATLFGCLGFGVIFQERLIEIPIPGIGTIKTAAEQTVEDVKFVKETRETVLAQSKTIGLVVQQANEASTKITDFESFLNTSQMNIESSMKLLSDRIEVLNPYRLPILSISCPTQIIQASNENIRSYNMNSGGYLRFMKGDIMLLSVSSYDSESVQTGNGRIAHYAKSYVST
jgi:hypothetical protein